MFNGKFNIGDEVVVDNEMYRKLKDDEYDIVDEMLEHRGKRTTIVDYGDFGANYFLDIDDRDFQWHEDLLIRMKNVNSDLMDGADCTNNTRLHEGDEDLDNVSYLPRLLKDYKEIYSGSDIITMIQDSELEDGDVYAIYCPTSTDVNFVVGCDNTPTMEELTKCDFVVVERKEYFRLDEAIEIMMKEGVGIRHKDWFGDEYDCRIQDVIESVFEEGRDNNGEYASVIYDRVWEVNRR